MTEFLLEIHSEEITANFQDFAAENLKNLICKILTDLKLQFINPRCFYTPRRLVIFIERIDRKQSDSIEEKKGPSIESPEVAINGFLKSVGKKINEVEVRDIKKGKFYFALIEEKGKYTKDLLAEILPDLLSKVSWPKSMKWGSDSVRWVRPIKSILCLYDERVIKFQYGLTQSSNLTYGHRFFSEKEIPVKSFSDYQISMFNSKVMFDQNQRRKEIIKQVEEISKSYELKLLNDMNLINELTGLVEWPKALVGSIDKEFMNLPQKILEVSIRTHQKYITLYQNEKIAEKFIIITNIISEESEPVVIKGNERVLKARLSDASFFYKNDLTKGLEYFSINLSKIVFHRELGDMSMKVGRIKFLSEKIYSKNYGDSGSHIDTAARLCKSDLLSETVTEFPELQGKIGGYLAKSSGLSDEVSDAIREHYSPVGPNDTCPSKPVTVTIALADKVDSLTGFYIAGERATGSGDQYGLRRSALGIIRIIIENNLKINLNSLFSLSLDSFIDQGIDTNVGNTCREIMIFIESRLVSYLKNKGIKYDIIAASVPFLSTDNLPNVMSRVVALNKFVNLFGVDDLLGGYKRAHNILLIEEKKDSYIYGDEPSIEIFEQDEENKLYEKLQEVSKNTLKYISLEKFSESMEELSHLNNPIDNFFKYVKVNSSDKLIRKNRLQLLAMIRNTFNKVADFSKLEGI